MSSLRLTIRAAAIATAMASFLPIAAAFTPSNGLFCAALQQRTTYSARANVMYNRLVQGGLCMALTPQEPSDTEEQPSDECICTMQYAPVCGADGKTYSNSCFAGCGHTDIAHEGEC